MRLLQPANSSYRVNRIVFSRCVLASLSYKGSWNALNRAERVERFAETSVPAVRANTRRRFNMSCLYLSNHPLFRSPPLLYCVCVRLGECKLNFSAYEECSIFVSGSFVEKVRAYFLRILRLREQSEDINGDFTWLLWKPEAMILGSWKLWFLEVGSYDSWKLEAIILGSWKLWFLEAGSYDSWKLEAMILGNWKLWFLEAGSYDSWKLEAMILGSWKLWFLEAGSYDSWKLEAIILGSWKVWFLEAGRYDSWKLSKAVFPASE